MISARDESTKVLREPFFLLAGTIASDRISTIPRILERNLRNYVLLRYTRSVQSAFISSAFASRGKRADVREP